MKISERLKSLFGTSNDRLVRAYRQVGNLYNNEVGGSENTIMDYGLESEEGQAAHKWLTDTAKLREFLYHEAFFSDTVYFEGGMAWGRSSYTQDLRFIGENAMRTLVDWVLYRKNQTADYPCDWGLDDFNAAHPDHAQEA